MKFYEVKRSSYRDEYLDGRMWDSSTVYYRSTFEKAKETFEELKRRALKAAEKDGRPYEISDLFDDENEYSIDFIEEWANESIVITLYAKEMDNKLEDENKEERLYE